MCLQTSVFLADNVSTEYRSDMFVGLAYRHPRRQSQSCDHSGISEPVRDQYLCLTSARALQYFRSSLLLSLEDH